jgi:excisionase family DNA binding protein
MTETLFQEKPLTVDDAAEFLNLKKSYLFKLIHYGKISCFRPGGKRVYFRLNDLKEYAFRNRQSADYELSDFADQVLAGGVRNDK